MSSPITWVNKPSTATPKNAANLQKISVRPWHNVKDYGATGDGFTDDRAAIQTAITTAGAHSTIYFPVGIYVISAALVVSQDYVTIQGSGHRSTEVYLQNGSNSSMLVSADDAVQRYALHVKDMQFSGNATNQTGTSPVISLRGMNEAHLDRLYIEEPRGEAIRSGQLTGGMFCTVPTITYCTIRGHATASLTDAIGLNTGSSDAIIVGCDIGFFSNGAAVLFSGHNGATVTATNVWQNLFGYYSFQSDDTRYTGCLSDFAKQHGFLGEDSNNLVYTGCIGRESSMATANTYDGFRFDTTNDVSLTGCRAFGSQQRVGVALFQNVTRARIVGGSFTGNQIAPHVIGSGVTDYVFRDVAGMADVTDKAMTLLAAATGSRPSASTSGAGAVMFDTTLGALIVSDGTAWNVTDAVAARNAQTGTTYTLVLADAGKVVEMSNASSNTLTVPPNSSVAFPVGTVLDIAQTGAGQTTIAAGAGVTINSRGAALKLAGQHAQAGIIKTATNTWRFYGDITT